MRRLPRVLMASFYSYPLEGGAEKQGRLLAQTLRTMGIEVAYVTARLPGMPAYEEREAVPFYRVAAPVWIKHRFFTGRSTLYVFALALFLLRFGRKYDIFHCHGAFDISAPALVGMTRWLGKISLVKHASMDDYAFLKNIPMGKLLFPLIRRANAYVGNSPPVYEAMLRAHHLPQARCFYIPNGVNLEASVDRFMARAQLGLKSNGPLAVCVSNFGPHKNQISAIRAWPQVLARHPGAMLVFVGAGLEMEKCRLEVHQLNLAEHILFLGRRSNVALCLDAADIFLFPSKTEGMSNALMEAMAHGLPCAAADIPGNRVLVDPAEDGLLFDPNDYAMIADEVLHLFNDVTLSQRLGAAARKKMREQYSLERMAERYLKLYQHLLHPEAGGNVSEFQPVGAH